MAETKTEYGARSIYDRRNPYRRPSALGVPSRSQWNPSEYDDLYVAKEGGRETYRKPSDNLEQEGGIDGTSISKLTYVPKDVERGQPIKPSNHFEYDGLDFDKGTEHSRFQEYDIGKRERGVKKEDNIPMIGRAVGKSETQDHYIEKDGQRVLVRGHARESNLEYDGLDFKEGSENRKYLTGMEVERPVRYKGAEHLGPLDGRIAGDSETNDQYSAKYGRRADNMKRSDYIKPNGLDFEGGTENGKYMKDMNFDRPEKYRSKSGNLKLMDGSLDGMTETNEKYKAQYGRRAEPIKQSGNIRTFPGKINGNTETTDKYDSKEYGKKESLSKHARESHLEYQGLNFSRDTENHEYLKGMQIEQPIRYIGLNNLKLAEGKFGEKTEYKGRYTQSARYGSVRVRPAISQDLMSPYDGAMTGPVVRLGDMRRYSSVTA